MNDSNRSMDDFEQFNQSLSDSSFSPLQSYVKHNMPQQHHQHITSCPRHSGGWAHHYSHLNTPQTNDQPLHSWFCPSQQQQQGLDMPSPDNATSANDPRHLHHDLPNNQINPIDITVANRNFFPQTYPSVGALSNSNSNSLRGTPGSSAFEDDSYESNDSDVDAEHEPYNRLLFKCLWNAPNQEMQLKDIYAWFKENTSKGQVPEEKGWQNSIRHNLSMNDAFQKGSRTDPTRPTKTLWSLSATALTNGIEPTTRFRNHHSRRHGRSSHQRRHTPTTHPIYNASGNINTSDPALQAAPQRIASGSKGGRAARRSARLLRATPAQMGLGNGNDSRRRARSVSSNAVPFYHHFPAPRPDGLDGMDGNLRCQDGSATSSPVVGDLDKFGQHDISQRATFPGAGSGLLGLFLDGASDLPFDDGSNLDFGLGANSTPYFHQENNGVDDTHHHDTVQLHSDAIPNGNGHDTNAADGLDTSHDPRPSREELDHMGMGGHLQFPSDMPYLDSETGENIFPNGGNGAFPGMGSDILSMESYFDLPRAASTSGEERADDGLHSANDANDLPRAAPTTEQNEAGNAAIHDRRDSGVAMSGLKLSDVVGVHSLARESSNLFEDDEEVVKREEERA